MVITALIAGVIALALGFGIKWFLDSVDADSEISWTEFALVGIIMTAMVIPGTLWVGKNLSVQNIVTYQQFLNGVHTKANDTITECYAGHSGQSASAGRSNCDFTYISGSYSWTEIYYVTVCTGSGDNKSCHPEPRTRTESANIYTPYATREHTYSIDSSFGFKSNDRFYFNGAYLDEEPRAYSSEPIPGNLPKGPPEAWRIAKQHLDAGDPLPVTALGSYPNYILASDDQVLRAYSSQIEHYRSAGILPDFAANINDEPITGVTRSHADKVAFVGVTVADQAMWQQSVMQFNAALGLKLQGDLHVVVVDDTKVNTNDSQAYLGALKAYWQDPAVYGKRALAKNAIILVLGTDGTKVTWAAASTGMPFGNELMAQYVQDWLPGVTLTPQAIFGSPKTVLHPTEGDKSEPTLTLSTPRGAFEKIVFEDAPFARASMSCADDGDACVGFADLVDTIEPKMWQKVVMVSITSVLAVILWIIAARVSIGEKRSRQSSTYTRSYDHYRF